jgi:hypothetical protein
MEDFGLFYGHLVYFTYAIWHILWPFGIYIYGSLVIISRFGMLYQDKQWQPWYCHSYTYICM